MSLLILAALVLGVGWAGAYYFGPSFFKSSNGPDSKTSPSHGNETTVPGENVRVLVDFGNRTRLWFNATVPHGWNYYNVTYKVTEGDMSATWFGYPIQSYFIYKILGFGCDPNQLACSGYWNLWVWNETGHCWNYSDEGVDLLQVSKVTTVAWHFSNYDGSNTFEGRCS